MRSRKEYWFAAKDWLTTLSDFNCSTYLMISKCTPIDDQRAFATTDLRASNGEHIIGKLFEQEPLQLAYSKRQGNNGSAAVSVSQDKLHNFTICEN
jgi:hypothetical protein